jgi:hypothetical protein
MLEAAAVVLNGQALHPIGCFEPALRKWRGRLDAAIKKNAASLDLVVSMKSVSPEIAYHLGALTADVMRARRAAR